LDPKVGRVMRESVPFLPESGQPGPRMEEIVKDQFGGRMRNGLDWARVVVKLTRARVAVVYLIAAVEIGDQIDDRVQSRLLLD
jgi:hypothetical protein